MPWNAYIVNALVAGALGAGTNELAVIAILRYILPKKKSEIARRIQSIVSTDLLSPEKIREKIDDPLVGDVLRKNIRDVLSDFLSRDLPAPRELLRDHRAEADTLTARLRASSLREYKRRVADPAFVSGTLRPFLSERWETLKHRTPESFLSSPPERFAEFAESWVRDLRESATLRSGVRQTILDWLGERMANADSFADLLSPAMIAAAEELAAEQTPVVVEQLTNFLREPGVRNAVAGSIIMAINEQLRGQGVLGNIKGALANAMRIENDIRGLCDKLPDALGRNLNRFENREKLARALRGAVRTALRREIGGEAVSGKKRERLVDMMLDRVWTPRTFEKLGRMFGETVSASMSRTLAETAAAVGVGVSRDAVLDEAAARAMRILSSEATGAFMAKQLDEATEFFMNKPLGRLERLVSPEGADQIADVAAREARLMIRERLAEFADEAGVWDIITASIESYDNRQLSNLVIQLARSELRWVTVLGGIIGIVVGLGQTFLQSFGWW